MPESTAGDRHVEKLKWEKKMSVLSFGEIRRGNVEFSRGLHQWCE